jgi:plasmid stability protein
MTSLTVRNLPEDAKRRFRQVAAAHGRSMEEHLRQMIIEADIPYDTPAAQVQVVRDVQRPFHYENEGENIVERLIRLADGAENNASDPRKYAEIRFMSAKDAMAELRRLANGVGFNPPRAMNTTLEAPEF